LPNEWIEVISLELGTVIAAEDRMQNPTGDRQATRIVRARCVWPAWVLLLNASVGCAGDDGFVPPDGGTNSTGGVSGGGASGTGGTTSSPKTVVEVCTAVCQAQYAGHCQLVVITTEQCPGVCSFLDAASQTCQTSTKRAFECQLRNNPCATTNCNDLLKKAEDDCPEKPW
jgi:hypothetical protein